MTTVTNPCDEPHKGGAPRFDCVSQRMDQLAQNLITLIDPAKGFQALFASPVCLPTVRSVHRQRFEADEEALWWLRDTCMRVKPDDFVEPSEALEGKRSVIDVLTACGVFAVAGGLSCGFCFLRV